MPSNDPQPWWYGYSTGRWDGDTLVVQTTGSATTDGWTSTAAAHRRGEVDRALPAGNYGSLEIEITVDDPKAYTRPWTVKIEQSIMLDTDLIEFVCGENEKSTHHFDK